MWWILFSTSIQANILTDEKPKGFLTINDLDLATYIAHLHLFTPWLVPLKYISTGVNNKAAEDWSHCDSIIIVTTTIPLFREAALIMPQARIHPSISHITGVENVDLSLLAFLQHFRSIFSQPMSWRKSLLPSGVTPLIHTMLITNYSLRACPL